MHNIVSLKSMLAALSLCQRVKLTQEQFKLDFDLLFSDGQKIPFQNSMHQLNVNKITIRLKSKILLQFSENCCENLHTYCLTYHTYTSFLKLIKVSECLLSKEIL